MHRNVKIDMLRVIFNKMLVAKFSVLFTLVSFPLFFKSVLRNMKCQAKLKYSLNESAKMVRFAILV